VLKARLKTTGVIEHTFALKTAADARAVDWKIYDVGGERSQRQAWAPYFDDVSAIIFLGARPCGSHRRRALTARALQRPYPRSTRCWRRCVGVHLPSPECSLARRTRP
jgi:hypothetical protein